MLNVSVNNAIAAKYRFPQITIRFSILEHENVDITRHVTYFLSVIFHVNFIYLAMLTILYLYLVPMDIFRVVAIWLRNALRVR